MRVDPAHVVAGAFVFAALALIALGVVAPHFVVHPTPLPPMPPLEIEVHHPSIAPARPPDLADPNRTELARAPKVHRSASRKPVATAPIKFCIDDPLCDLDRNLK